MKATKRNLIDILQGENCFIIPVYQRAYKWTKAQCQRLLDDLYNVIETNENKSHFLGTVVYIADENNDSVGVNKFIVIDGQQRITTISILLLAIRNYILNKKLDIETKPENIYNYNLVNTGYDGDNQMKLHLSKEDKDIYRKLLFYGLEMTDDDDNNVYRNYMYFYDTLDKTNVNVDELYKAIKNLTIANVLLTRGVDNPQLIFESMNSKGDDLNKADLIRNYILMGLNSSTQERFYYDYWYPMEKNTETEKKDWLTDFIRDFLIMKNKRNISHSKVYEEFKGYAKLKINGKTKENDVEEILKEIQEYSRYFAYIIKQNHINQKVNRSLYYLHEWGNQIVRPILMRLLKELNDEYFTDKEFIKTAQLIESYIFRRRICDIEQNALQNVFYSLNKYVDKNNIYQSIVDLLVNRRNNEIFSSDADFLKNFKTKEMEKALQPNNILYILEKFNNIELNDGKIQIEKYNYAQIIDGDKISIEENLSNTIGNLQLVVKNKATQKLDLKTAEAKKYIEERNEELGHKALKIWPKPETDVVIHTLDDQWTHGRPEKIFLLGETIRVSTLKDAYIQTIESLYELSRLEFITATQRIRKTNVFNLDSSKLTEPMKIKDSDVYMNIQNDADGFRQNIKQVFSKLKLDDYEFGIVFKK